MSIFAGAQRQLHALPRQAPAQRGLFGGGRSVNPSEVLGFLIGGPGYVGRMREGQREEQAQQRALGDQQWRRARAGTLFQGDPIAQDLYSANNEEFMKSLGGRYRDEVLAAGSVRSRGTATGAEAVAAAPRVERFDDRFGAFDPMTGATTFSQPRGMTEAEITTRELGLGNLDVAQQNAATNRITATRPQAVTTGTGAVTTLIGSDGTIGEQIQGRQPAATPNAAQTELRQAYDTNQNEVIPTITQMRSMLQSGDVITGIGADIRLNAARALAAAGNQDAQRQVAATEAYRNMSGRLRVGMAKTLGANPSNADLILLERVTAGDINQSTDALLATLDQGLTFANGRTASLQSQLGSQQQGSGRVAYDAEGNRYVVRNGQWVPE